MSADSGGYVASRLLYWFGSVVLALLPVVVLATNGFTIRKEWSEIYLSRYSDIIIVVMTFLGLAIFDAFEIFRCLDRHVSWRYVASVVLALGAFFFFCAMLAHFSTYSIQKALIEAARPVEEGRQLQFRAGELSVLWMVSALAICVFAKGFATWLEFHGNGTTTEGKGSHPVEMRSR